MSDDAPLVSIIVPNYNNGKYITQCVESIELQTYANIEVVIVDDASTDNSREVLQKLIQIYPNIITVFLKHNSGVSHARNTGFEYSNGEFICFIDPDDFFCSNEKIENEMNLIYEYQNKGHRIIAYSGVICVNEQGEYVEDRGVSGQLTGHAVAAYLARYKEDRHSRNETIDRLAFVESGGYDEGMSFWEDYDMLLRLLRIRDIYCTGKYGTAYRYTMTGLSHAGGDSEKVLRRLEKQYYTTLALYDKALFLCYKGKRYLYEFKRRTIPLLLHKGSKVKHALLGR